MAFKTSSVFGSQQAGGGLTAPVAKSSLAASVQASLDASDLTARNVYTVSATAGVDCSAAVAAGIAALKLVGGGILRFPWIGGYSCSSQVIIDASNIVVDLQDDWTYTGKQAPTATAGGVFCFTGTTSVYLNGAGLIAPRRVRIDCNGRNITYTYSLSSQYAGVYFRMCEAPLLRNVHAYNSAHYGIQFSYCPNGVMENVAASDTINDNGIQVVANAEHIRPYSDTDPTTWGNVRIINPTCWNNRNHAVGTWGSVGLTIENPVCWNNGNNDGASNAGPAGGINFEYDQTADPTAARNYRGRVVNPMVYGSWGFGIRSNCKGTKITGGIVQGTKKPTAYTDGTPAIWGSAIFAQQNCTMDIDGTVIDGSDLYGIRAQGGGTQFPTVRFKGEIRGCVDRAVYSVGARVIDIDPSSYIHDNGTVAGGAPAVDLNNSALNANGGTFRVAGRYDSNGGQVVQAASVGEIDITVLHGHNNCAGLASANHAIYIPSCQRLKAADIMLTVAAGNVRQARVLKCDSAVQAVIDRRSILGDQTNTTSPRADVVATTLVGDTFVTAAPATAPLYMGQMSIDTTNGKVYYAKGQASSADWLLLN